jgi:hypothetical protein
MTPETRARIEAAAEQAAAKLPPLSAEQCDGIAALIARRPSPMTRNTARRARPCPSRKAVA